MKNLGVCNVLHKGYIGEIFRISFPMMVSYACEMAMIFIDRVFMARLGSELMSAAMMGGLSVFMAMTFFMGLTGYTNALSAQYMGAGKERKCSAVLGQSVWVSLVSYPLIIAAGPLVLLFFDHSGISELQLIPQKRYFGILVFGAVFSLLRNSFSSFFAGIGKTSVVMAAALISAVVNIITNYILIFGKLGFPAMGIEGAAIGTIFGGFVSVVMLFVYYRGTEYYRLNRMKFLKFNRKIMGKLFKFGYPAGLEMFLNVMAFNIMISIFHSHSLPTAIAASIVFSWDMVSFIPLIGLQIGVTSLSGRYMGAGKPDDAHKSTMSGLIMGWLYSGTVLIVFVLFAENLVDIFRPEASDQNFAAARPLAVFMVRLASLYVMVDTIFIVFTGALRGAGDTFWAMVITGILHWTLVPVLFVILNVLELSPEAGWISVVTVFISFSGFIIWRYADGKWRSIKVIG